MNFNKFLYTVCDKVFKGREFPDYIAMLIFGLNKSLKENTGSLCNEYMGTTISISTCTYEDSDSEPYFIIYNNERMQYASKCARISMKNPGYIYYGNTGIKKQWVLGKSEKENLMCILNSKYDNEFNTVWDKICHDYQTMIEGIGTTQMPSKPLLLPIPDYTKLKWG